jgi:hypothetical protein
MLRNGYLGKRHVDGFLDGFSEPGVLHVPHNAYDGGELLPGLPASGQRSPDHIERTKQALSSGHIDNGNLGSIRAVGRREEPASHEWNPQRAEVLWGRIQHPDVTLDRPAGPPIGQIERHHHARLVRGQTVGGSRGAHAGQSAGVCHELLGELYLPRSRKRPAHGEVQLDGHDMVRRDTYVGSDQPQEAAREERSTDQEYQRDG